jgi:hypothetical protein
MLRSITKTTLAGITAAAIALTTAAPAQAWGQRERDFLKGIVATVIVTEIIRDSKRHHQPAPRPAPQPQPVQYTSISQTPAAMAFNSYSYNQRRVIQQRLSAYGYYNSSIDGSFGRGTYNAVVAYARDNGQSLANRNGAFAVYDGLIY